MLADRRVNEIKEELLPFELMNHASTPSGMDGILKTARHVPRGLCFHWDRI